MKKYIKDITSGKIKSCIYVKQAIDRHIRDLKRKDIFYSQDAADHAIKFFTFLKQSKGEWCNQVLELESWQRFIISQLFGWRKKKDGTRRYRIAYIEVSRKNGKSTMVSGLGLYLFYADNEPGAEVYTAATMREQARITHLEATRMVKKSPFLASKITIYRDNLNILNTASKFQPLGADIDGLDGLNVHGCIIDELHAHKKRDLFDVIKTATSSRRQPLIIAITTAGVNQTGICYEQHEYVQKILNNTIQDDSYFGIIYTLDQGDNWEDEENWIKANPNLGVSVKLDDLRDNYKMAKEIVTAQNNFKRKHLNIWTQQTDRWIDLSMWDENNLFPTNEDYLTKLPAVGGIDLSAVSDLTAWVMLFYDAKLETISVLCRVWCPEKQLYNPANKFRDQYQAWEKQGYLLKTKGEVLDYSFIRAQILRDTNKFNIWSIAIDRLFQGYEFATELDREMGGYEKKPKVFACGMGFLSMAGPCLEFEKLLIKRKLNHGGNPILRWMADNIAVQIDPAGNRKPNKVESQGKIDGIVGILLALDRFLREKLGESKSIYEDRGVLTL